MSFSSPQRVRFGDCDTAGIGYFPRLLALVDNAVEDWLIASIGIDRAAMHVDQRLGLPTVNLQTGFQQPCQLGETLDIAITPTQIGATSITLAAGAHVAGIPRFSATLVQVLIDLETGKPRAWPAGWRDQLSRFAANPHEVRLAS
jgi:4-hydroxybenzoyl-CoA thioesterase